MYGDNTFGKSINTNRGLFESPIFVRLSLLTWAEYRVVATSQLASGGCASTNQTKEKSKQPTKNSNQTINQKIKEKSKQPNYQTKEKSKQPTKQPIDNKETNKVGSLEDTVYDINQTPSTES